MAYVSQNVVGGRKGRRWHETKGGTAKLGPGQFVAEVLCRATPPGLTWNMSAPRIHRVHKTWDGTLDTKCEGCDALSQLERPAPDRVPKTEM